MEVVGRWRIRGDRVMAELGCALWIWLWAIAFVLFGGWAVYRGDIGFWGALGYGVLVCVAVVSSYLAAVTIADRRQRKRNPKLIGAPTWTIAAIWVIFIASTAAWIALLLRMRRGGGGG
jgi:hypothetical protein